MKKCQINLHLKLEIGALSKHIGGKSNITEL